MDKNRIVENCTLIINRVEMIRTNHYLSECEQRYLNHILGYAEEIKYEMDKED